MSNTTIWPIDKNLSVQPLRARVDLGAIVMKLDIAFPKAPALLESDY